MNRVILALTAFITLTGATLPKPNGEQVIDQADILSPKVEAELNAKLYAYERQYKHQLAVVTIASLEDEAIENYAVDLFREHKLGREGADDGILLLVAPNDRKMRIEVGDGMSFFLTDALSSLIIGKTITPLFKDGKMEEGVMAGADKIIEATSLTNAQMASKINMQAELDAREEAFQRQQWAATKAKMKDWLMGALAFLGLGGVGWGSWYTATAKSRRQRRAEEARVAAAKEAERQRLKEEARKAEIAAIEEAARQRAAMLAAMTPAKRAAFIAQEAADAKARALAAAAAYAARRKQEEAEAEQRRIADEQRREREAQQAASTSSWGSGGLGNGRFSGNFSGGGGTSSGSGASGSW